MIHSAVDDMGDDSGTLACQSRAQSVWADGSPLWVALMIVLGIKSIGSQKMNLIFSVLWVASVGGSCQSVHWVVQHAKAYDRTRSKEKASVPKRVKTALCTVSWALP